MRPPVASELISVSLWLKEGLLSAMGIFLVAMASCRNTYHDIPVQLYIGVGLGFVWKCRSLLFSQVTCVDPGLS